MRRADTAYRSPSAWLAAMIRYLPKYVASALLLAPAFATAGVPSTASEAALRALIARQTDAFTEASSRGDQQAMGELLDDQVLFSNGDGSVQRDEKLDETNALSDLLKRQTQAIRAARQRADVATMRRYLDPDALFVNEDGVLLSGRDVFQGVSAPGLKGVLASVVMTDWVLHHSGDAAVSTSTDNQVLRYGDQVLNKRLLSVDVWVRRAAGWKLISSHTIALRASAQPQTTLPEDQLDDYLGSYVNEAGLSTTITREGSELTLSGIDEASLPVAASVHSEFQRAETQSTIRALRATVHLRAEVRDLFIDAAPKSTGARLVLRLIFSRDAEGRVTGYVMRLPALGDLAFTKGIVAGVPNGARQGISTVLKPPPKIVFRHFGDVMIASFVHERVTSLQGVVMHTEFYATEAWIRRGRQWKMITSQGNEVHSDPAALLLPATALEAYAGAYTAGTGLTVTLVHRGNGLAASVSGHEVGRLEAAAHDVFFTPGSSAFIVIFQRNAEGHVAGFLSRYASGDVRFGKMRD